MALCVFLSSTFLISQVINAIDNEPVAANNIKREEALLDSMPYIKSTFSVNAKALIAEIPKTKALNIKKNFSFISLNLKD